jgi:asparagine synthase (glutamine-hydrolysing)
VSGIAGAVNRANAPLDCKILPALLDSLAFRGPDGAGQWQHGNAGLVHTWFALTGGTPGDAQPDRQPQSLDGQVWITADARVDARPELFGALRSAGREVSPTATDAELILHAYHAWGTECVGRLLGDFAFAIVDTTNRRLFCGRDQLGVKPFFYACGDQFLVFSNTLDCVRRHPAVSNDLDEKALADFLLFGWNLDTSATAFADIRRLPAGHRLVLSPEGLRIEAYWTPKVPDELRHSRQQDYIDQFLEIFASAVSDRIRTSQVGIFLSGGLDSSSVACMALGQLQQRSLRGRLWAATHVFDRLIPDGERPFAAQVSAALGITQEFFPVDDFKPYDEFWDTETAQTPEPNVRSFLSAYRNSARESGTHARVFLAGNGGDEGLRPPGDYYLCLLREGRIGRWGADFVRHLVAHRELPHHRVRATLRAAVGRAAPGPVFPDWLNPDLVRRWELKSRWHDFWAAYRVHRSRIPAYMTNMTNGVMVRYFERIDAGHTGIPLERYSPLFDLRLLEFLFSLPTVPWKIDKFLLRRAMQGRLPEGIVHRPKTPLAGDPVLAYFRTSGFRFPVEWTDCVKRTPELESFRTQPVDTSRERTDFRSESVHGDVRCFELASWLHNRKPRPASRGSGPS